MHCTRPPYSLTRRKIQHSYSKKSLDWKRPTVERIILLYGIFYIIPIVYLLLGMFIGYSIFNITSRLTISLFFLSRHFPDGSWFMVGGRSVPIKTTLATVTKTTLYER